MKDSSKEVNLGNNSTRFRFRCDTFGTAKRDNQAESLFLHNLSSFLYTSSLDGARRGACTRVVDGVGRGAGGYFSGSHLALAHSRSRQHFVELASGCASCRLIARRDCVEIPYGFCGRGRWWHAHVLACGLSGHGRPLAFAGGVATAACGSSVRLRLRISLCAGFRKPVENFFKKVLDRNRRSVNIVDAPFTGN